MANIYINTDGGIKKYLEEKYQELLKEYYKDKESYEKTSEYVELKKELVRAFKNQKQALKKVKEFPLVFIITNLVGAFIKLTLLSDKSLLTIIIPLIIINAISTYTCVSNYIKYKQNKKTVNEGLQEIDSNYAEYKTSLLINDFTLAYDQKRLEDIEKKLEEDQDGIVDLYSILEADDFGETTPLSGTGYKIFEEALQAEWDNYLEMVSKTNPSEIDLTNEGMLKEVAPIELSLAPKRKGFIHSFYIDR